MAPTSIPGSGSIIGCWGALGPNSRAERTPLHGSAGSGARKRRAPTGGLA